MKYVVIVGLVVAAALIWGLRPAESQTKSFDLSEYAKSEQGDDMSEELSNRSETATLGGGCFWCIEAVYERITGVTDAVSGYAGGATEHPTYRQVTGGRTGHAEVVQVTFDPETVTYEEILEIFFKSHDPTTKNRQGADVGTQYRSIILYHDEDQRQTAEEVMSRSQELYNNPIVTELEPLDRFYPAEEYHQDYFAKNPYAGYCSVVIAPKLKRLGLEGAETF